ncbi:MAG: RNA polymerase subunit sigma [Gammaproteobacteria bacterium HGW-Gammaproteobacteria-11]|nr:MAG: RNA polymerase subunit sigma [Gammaproteobacteria bacterium HGW-Gammaproteobacteria-11]
MSSESLQESLSALMDDEAGELEVRRILQASEGDPALRKTWERFQIARAMMHKEPWQGRVDISAGIAAAIATEQAPTATASRAGRVWHNLGRVAVAASVTLAVLVGVNMFNQQELAVSDDLAAVERATPQMSPSISVPQGGGAVLAGFSAPAPVEAETASQSPTLWHEQRIGTYLREHAEHSSRFGSSQVLPYARAASLESR